jgi:hypothetical protein
VQHQRYLSQYLFGKRQQAQITNGSGMALYGIRAGFAYTNYHCGVTPRPRQVPNAECTCPKTFRYRLIHSAYRTCWNPSPQNLSLSLDSGAGDGVASRRLSASYGSRAKKGVASRQLSVSYGGRARKGVASRQLSVSYGGKTRRA